MRDSYDYIIVGSGIGGLYTALLAREHGSVLLLTKGTIEDCNTRYAQGGIAAAVGDADSPELHEQDTLEAGAGLCVPETVRILAREGPTAIQELVRLGVEFDTQQGEVLLAREGAHSVPRVLHAGGDATGANIETALMKRLLESGATVKEHAMLTSIVVSDDGRATGVRAFHAQTGEESEFAGRFIVLATGGAGRLFRYTTNPEVATGDGVALAFRAGAAVNDMEFYQFHPTALHLPGAPTFLISEAVRGEGGVLRNALGEAFMARYHAMGDLAPRDVVARAIDTEMRATSSPHALLDVTHIRASRITTRFPTIYSYCLGHGLDITKQPIPVAPAAHYMIGGIKTTSWGETTVPGLYACGEVASTGAHGANRLASNSLLETMVFGKRLVERTLGRNGGEPDGDRTERVFKLPNRHVPCAQVPPLTLGNLQDLLWRNSGLVRNGDELLWAARVLSVWRTMSRARQAPMKSGQGSDRAANELVNMVLIARLMVEGALVRQESRGAHYRTDFPEPRKEWELHTVFVGEERGWHQPSCASGIPQ
ncbi:MAG: L-aspartate oxidase [Dehalococcoidia bacterium]|nr:L-aspartate oxidase [Dehalococcoidia bacterium]